MVALTINPLVMRGSMATPILFLRNEVGQTGSSADLSGPSPRPENAGLSDHG
jgi:hypothetical protein